MTKSIAIVTALVSAFGGWGSVQASDCSACDQVIIVSREAINCLSQRINDLVEEARATNPLLVNLAECPGGPRENGSSDQDRGEMPGIPSDPTIPRDPTIPHETTRGSKKPPPPPPVEPNFVILSLRQLECLGKYLNTLRTGDNEPIRFDFQVCNET